MKLTCKLDSVAGDRCLIIYTDDKPTISIWESALSTHRGRAQAIDQLLGATITAQMQGDLPNLITTIRALGGGYEQICDAVNVYLDNILNGKEGG